MLQACDLLLAHPPIVLVVPNGGEGPSKVDDFMLKKEATVLDFQLQGWWVSVRLVTPEDELSSFLVSVSLRAVCHSCGGVVHETARDESVLKPPSASGEVVRIL